MKGLPKGHIARNPGEIAAHGKHADMIATTRFGNHHVRVVELLDGRRVGVNDSGHVVGSIVKMDDKEYFLEDNVTVSPRFDDNGIGGSVNMSSPDYFANREDALMGNGMPDPRGTGHGGYNPR